MISFLQLCISVRENQSPTKLLPDIKPGNWVNPLGWHVVIVTGKQLGAFITHTISNTLRNFTTAVCLYCFYLPVANTPFVRIRALNKVQCIVGAPKLIGQ